MRCVEGDNVQKGHVPRVCARIRKINRGKTAEFLQRAQKSSNFAQNLQFLVKSRVETGESVDFSVTSYGELTCAIFLEDSENYQGSIRGTSGRFCPNLRATNRIFVFVENR